MQKMSLGRFTSSLLMFRPLMFWLLMFWFTIPTAEAQSKKIRATGISPYWLKKPLPNTLTVWGEATDSLEALTEAFRAARAQLISQLVYAHHLRTNDSLLSLQDHQHHYRSYLFDQTALHQWVGIQLMGIPIDSHRIRAQHLEYRRDKQRGRNFYRIYLNLHWPDSLSQKLSDDFYDYDKAFSDFLQSAQYYLNHPTDLALLGYMIERLRALPDLLTDYRAKQAEALLRAYRQMYLETSIHIDHISETDFRISLKTANRHMPGSYFVYEINNCVQIDYISENEHGFHFSYDESRCPEAAQYFVCIRLMLPDSSERSVEIALPGNRVSMRAKSPITLHYFEESKDGYAEMNLFSVSGQDYFIRELHFAGMRFDLSMNGRGRSIRGVGTYLLRAPITQEQYKQLLRLNPSKVDGGFIYTHPSSGLPMDACFEGIGIQLKKHKN
ncbi:MAG: hypothetical protein ACK417_04465 [Bacteroidia bacterium]